jgi:hypothetical protein
LTTAFTALSSKKSDGARFHVTPLAEPGPTVEKGGVATLLGRWRNFSSQKQFKAYQVFFGTLIEKQ